MQRHLPLSSLALVAFLASGQVVAQSVRPADPTIARPGTAHVQSAALPAPTAARTNAPWTAMAPMTTARAQSGTVAHPNGKIYVFGGWNGNSTFSAAEAYDIATNTWSSIAPMPVDMQGPATALGNDGNIYSFAGRNQSSGYRTECFRYNPTTNLWTTIATMPVPRWEARALTAANGLIYVFGGWNADQNPIIGNEVQIYNPATNTWTAGTAMPARVMGMAAAMDGAGLMHIYGGIGDNPYPPLVSHYIYNPATNTWTTGPNLPNPGRGYTSGTSGSDGFLYITGGDSDIVQGSGATIYNNVDFFNTATNAWSTGTALPVALTELRTVASGNNLYVIGGLTGSSSPSAAVYRMATVAVVTATTWTGNASSDWYAAGNWSDGVPTASLDAIIPSGRPNMPAIAASTGTAKALTINSGATLTLSGGTLDLKANLTNNGTLAATGGLVTLTGAAAQTLGGSSTTTLYNMTVGAPGATLGGPVRVQRLLTLTGNLNSGGNLTLVSTVALSGMVVESGGQLQGQLAVQRAASGATAGYRHFAAPVTGATVDQLGSGGSPIVINPSYNTVGNTVTPFPTVFGYDQSRLSSATPITSDFDYGWASPTSASQLMLPGRALTAQLTGAQVVTLTGTATNASVSVSGLGNSGTANSGWQLLGNPYLAPMTLSALRPALQTGGLADAVYVFRPSGDYSGSYDQYVNGVGTGSLAAGQVALGQGFFVRNVVANSSGSVTFTNAMRATTYANPGFLRPATTDLRPRLDLRLTGGGAADVVVFYAEAGATDGADARFDAWKLPTGTPLSVATATGAEQLAIQGLPDMTAARVLPLTVGTAQAGTFTFEAEQLLNFPATASVVLEDRLTGTLHDLRTGAYAAQLTAGRNDGRFFLRLSDSRVLATANPRLSAALQLYPNPTAGKAYLGLAVAGAARIEVLNAVGQRVLVQAAKASNGLVTAELNTAGLSRGVYAVRVTTAEGTAISRLVVE